MEAQQFVRENNLMRREVTVTLFVDDCVTC